MVDERIALIWRPVESSNVAMIGWPQHKNQVVIDAQITNNPGEPFNFESKLLLVLFKDGRCYGYLGVSRQRAVYIATRERSPGSYINQVVKKKFSAVRIPELDVNGPPF